MKRIICILLVLAFAQCYAEAPEYTGEPRTTIADISFALPGTSAGIFYFPLDDLGRATGAIGILGPETIASTYRLNTQNIKPSGWVQERYPSIPGESLYQRCHLIGDQLGGAEIYENLVTGTQYLNMNGMLPIENSVVNYIKSTGNHVQYEVHPYYIDDNLVCEGIAISARSIEDDGLSIVEFCHNVQPGISIDYATGESVTNEVQTRLTITADSTVHAYVLNTNTMRFHYPTCNSVNAMKPENRQEYT